MPDPADTPRERAIAAGWTDTFDDGWRAALVALCDARNSRRTRRWAYRAFLYLRQRHADMDWPIRLPPEVYR